MNPRKPSVYKLIAFGLNSFHFYPAIYICTYSVVHFGCSRGTQATFQPSSSIFQACFTASLPSKSFPPFSTFFSVSLRNQRSKLKECYFHQHFCVVNYRAECMTGAKYGFIFLFPNLTYFVVTNSSCPEAANSALSGRTSNVRLRSTFNQLLWKTISCSFCSLNL